MTHRVSFMSFPLATADATTGPPRTVMSRSVLLANCQTLSTPSSSPSTMAFKNEVVSDEDIDRYHLPFPKGEGRWWTRDAERDYYLWGGLTGNRAFDDTCEGRFHFFVDGTNYWVKLLPGICSKSLKENPYTISWNSIIRIQPDINGDIEMDRFVTLLKEALVVYGYEGEDDGWVKNVRVLFGF
jgi:hypothetical protein